jgi:hypothetical protein
MKMKNKIKKLRKRQEAYDNLKDQQGRKRPGSVNK